jgi:hypothetical protein
MRGMNSRRQHCRDAHRCRPATVGHERSSDNEVRQPQSGRSIVMTARATARSDRVVDVRSLRHSSLPGSGAFASGRQLVG